jgi:hypothetical protein
VRQRVPEVAKRNTAISAFGTNGIRDGDKCIVRHKSMRPLVSFQIFDSLLKDVFEKVSVERRIVSKQYISNCTHIMPENTGNRRASERAAKVRANVIARKRYKYLGRKHNAKNVLRFRRNLKKAVDAATQRLDRIMHLRGRQ